jgi:hypothetical protein
MIYIGPRTKIVAITHMSNADAGSGRPAANAGIRRPRYLKIPLDARAYKRWIQRRGQRRLIREEVGDHGDRALLSEQYPWRVGYGQVRLATCY